ncbi:MAG: hypothetical protein QOF45_1815 [Gaiellaceae bacterium]|jgi:beta-lactam-binding protein with PASTA domain|nr:hypothetical protein [Gaiellaceae bacterium]
MTAGIFARVPTVAAIVVVALLATATLTLAATSNAPTPVQAAAAPVAQPTLVVPDVRRQAYVFAKGALEQAGFAWKITGSVQGYAANVVAVQSPAPGTHVIANGAPTISLQLSHNSAYKQEGLPENASPYHGRPIKLVAAKSTLAKPAAKPKSAAKPAVKPAATTAAKQKPKAATAKPVAPVSRKPAFTEAGAPKEPLDEMALTARAKQLGTWLESHKTRTPRNVNHWLYQHNWIVTGAGFGWHDGSEALRTLIQVDARVQKLWGVGGKSEQVARRALAEVKARAQ